MKAVPDGFIVEPHEMTLFHDGTRMATGPIDGGVWYCPGCERDRPDTMARYFAGPGDYVLALCPHCAEIPSHCEDAKHGAGLVGYKR